MPTSSTTSFPVFLSSPGQWVFVEEFWKEGSWVDNNRQLDVPSGLRVTLRHNLVWPPWVWEVGLNEGLHTFYVADLWNKFQVRLDTPESGVVVWII